MNDFHLYLHLYQFNPLHPNIKIVILINVVPVWFHKKWWGEFVEVSIRFIFPDHVLNSPDHCFIYYKEKFHADHSFEPLCTGFLLFWVLQIPWLSMTFSKTFSVFHDLMRSCHFQKFQNLTGVPVLAYTCIFFTLHSSTETNSGIHQNACHSHCLIITPLHVLSLFCHLQ